MQAPSAVGIAASAGGQTERGAVVRTAGEVDQDATGKYFHRRPMGVLERE